MCHCSIEYNSTIPNGFYRNPAAGSGNAVFVFGIGLGDIEQRKGNRVIG